MYFGVMFLRVPILFYWYMILKLLEIRSESGFRPLCNLIFMCQRFCCVGICAQSCISKWQLRLWHVAKWAQEEEGRTSLWGTLPSVRDSRFKLCDRKSFSGTTRMCQTHRKPVIVKTNRYIYQPSSDNSAVLSIVKGCSVRRWWQLKAYAFL